MKSPWLYSEYPYTHHSLPGGTQPIPINMAVSLVVPQSIPLFITISLVELTLSLYSSQSSSWYSDYPYTHHSLPGGSQTFPILITVCLVVLRLSLYSSQSPCWYSDYPFTHHSLPVGTQTIPLCITASLVVLGLSQYTSQSPWWYSN